MCLNKLHFPFTNVKSKIPELELWAIKTNTTFFYNYTKKKKNSLKKTLKVKQKPQTERHESSEKPAPGSAT